MSDITLATPLKLPCGAVVPNRIIKAPMTEGLADAQNRSTPELDRLYELWSEGGAGCLITGNVQVMRDHLERPGNVVIDSRDGLDALQSYARAGTKAGNHLWMQINHPGRQAPAFVTPEPLAPSSVQFGKNPKAFGVPRALSENEIEDIIARFAFVAGIARETGFTGIQIHSAHGYLLSEFLSPVVNQRTDKWGGALENRARMLLAIVDASRKATAPDFPISVKLNSSDFQKGGFTLDDCIQVVRWLGERGVDLLEISGGTYEQPAMVGGVGNAATYQDPLKDSTRQREAYFVDYARAIKPAANMPIMVTGGFRTRAAMEHALSLGDADAIGLARPMCAEPDAPAKLLAGADAISAFEDQLTITPEEAPNVPPEKLPGLIAHGQQGWFCMNIINMGQGKGPDLNMTCLQGAQLYDQNEAATQARRAAA